MDDGLNSESPLILSPDGLWCWDGAQWVPNQAFLGQRDAAREVASPLSLETMPTPAGTTQGGHRTMLLGGLAGAAVVILIGAVASIGAGMSGASGSASSGAGTGSGGDANSLESASAVEGLSLPAVCEWEELATPYTRWTASMTGPIRNTSGHTVSEVFMVAEVLSDGQVIGVKSTGPFEVGAEPSTARHGVPLDLDWPIDPSTDTCRLSLVPAGSEPTNRWIGASADHVGSDSGAASAEHPPAPEEVAELLLNTPVPSGGAFQSGLPFEPGTDAAGWEDGLISRVQMPDGEVEYQVYARGGGIDAMSSVRQYDGEVQDASAPSGAVCLLGALYECFVLVDDTLVTAWGSPEEGITAAVLQQRLADGIAHYNRVVHGT